MLVSLTTTSPEQLPSTSLVGGKAASLAKLYSTPSLSLHVPNAHALTVEFFQPWITAIVASEEYDAVKAAFAAASVPSSTNADTEQLCGKLKDMCRTMPLSMQQQTVLTQLQTEMKSWSPLSLAAVRSSAPEEDGTGASFAGAFETCLGVTPDALEGAARSCLASLFDTRVFSYKMVESNHQQNEPAFAAVVMEMIDSHIAGVAFSANPLNSDRDEMVLDSSWGLGESVVDGSVNADRYVYDRIESTIIERAIGKKVQEKRLSKDGGVDLLPVDDDRQMKSSLTDEQISQLAKLVALVEDMYGMPMDVEWSYVAKPTDNGDSSLLEVKLLQARPITTLFCLDDFMMTKPGEKRVLYYDFNIASEATTTTPFTRMDMKLYTKMTSMMMGTTDTDIFPYNDELCPMFCASTRQYVNLSMFLKFITPKYLSESVKLLDPYLAAIFASSDCDRKRYLMDKLPKGVSLRNGWKLFRGSSIMEMYKASNKYKTKPADQMKAYMEVAKGDEKKMIEIKERGVDKSKGLQAFADELFEAAWPSFFEELSCVMFVVVPMFQTIDKKRREGKTAKIREENDALCSGYEGDQLMAMNVEMYKLANALPSSIWDEYPHEDLHKLAVRIKDNLNGSTTDLPTEFLREWAMFMELFGFDGQDQMFLSCPRYNDTPELLLGKMKQSVGSAVNDPAATHGEQATKRKTMMMLHEQRAKKNWFLKPFAHRKTKNRNDVLSYLMWMRNAPKLRCAKLIGILRAEILQVEEELLQSKRLDEAGDIFHLDLPEVDAALRDETVDLRNIVAPRKAIHETATRAKLCPLLVDSRCRILKPDPPVLGDDPEEGLILGAAVSPGVARGRVRILDNPNEKFEPGEVLAAVVTSPAWTPLFVGAAAVILQIGGALQHGALCAREYGKPAVSNIDVHTLLKTGDMVEVDGNTGIVRIISDKEE